MEKGSSLGGGEDGWCGVGVGVRGRRDCHDERMQMRWGSWTVGGESQNCAKCMYVGLEEWAEDRKAGSGMERAEGGDCLYTCK